MDCRICLGKWNDFELCGYFYGLWLLKSLVDVKFVMCFYVNLVSFCLLLYLSEFFVLYCLVNHVCISNRQLQELDGLREMLKIQSQ